MELKDTVKLMTSSDYEDRFRAEYYQLHERITKLSEMLYKYKYKLLDFTPKCNYDILYKQLKYMEHYEATLGARAIIEGIDLKE